MGYTVHIHDPNATVDYVVTWATWLGSDTISTSSWIVPSGVTQTAASNTTTTATVWISGGTVGNTYLITNRITTAAGRTDDQSFVLDVQPK